MYATYIPASGGLSATTVTQIIIGVVFASVPVVICCIRISAWVSSQLHRRQREEDVVEETVFDDIGQAMCIRGQKSELNVPTYNEIRLEEYRKGLWMEVQVSFGFNSTGGRPYDLECTKFCSLLPLLSGWSYPKKAKSSTSHL